MRLLPRTILLLTLALLMAAPLLADDKKKGKGKKKGKRVATAPAFRLPKTIQLSDDQKAKLAELKKEHGPKLAEAQKALRSILTPEQRKARNQARKDAVAAGRKGKELRQAVNAAVTLSDEQRQKLKEAQKAYGTLNKKVRSEVLALLTAEQKSQLSKKGKNKSKKKKKKSNDA